MNAAEPVAGFVPLVKGHAETPDITLAQIADGLFRQRLGAAEETAWGAMEGKIGFIQFGKSAKPFGMGLEKLQQIGAAQFALNGDGLVFLDFGAGINGAEET